MDKTTQKKKNKKKVKKLYKVCADVRSLDDNVRMIAIQTVRKMLSIGMLFFSFFVFAFFGFCFFFCLCWVVMVL